MPNIAWSGKHPAPGLPYFQIAKGDHLPIGVPSNLGQCFHSTTPLYVVYLLELPPDKPGAAAEIFTSNCCQSVYWQHSPNPG